MGDATLVRSVKRPWREAVMEGDSPSRLDDRLGITSEQDRRPRRPHTQHPIYNPKSRTTISLMISVAPP